MSKLSKILWNIFASMLVFACCNSANADAQNSVGTLTTSEENHTLCRAGYYVSKCGNHTVGTNWLKGYSGGPNYYDYSRTKNLENLRHFFSDDGADIVYTTLSGALQTVSSTTYIQKRNNLLTAICDPVNVQIACSPCPGMATVPASTVDIDNSGSLVSDSWKFHTIADCYMQEFADSTGIFEYVDDQEHTQNCYYAHDVAGNAIIMENTANSSQYNER